MSIDRWMDKEYVVHVPMDKKAVWIWWWEGTLEWGTACLAMGLWAAALSGFRIWVQISHYLEFPFKKSNAVRDSIKTVNVALNREFLSSFPFLGSGGGTGLSSRALTGDHTGGLFSLLVCKWGCHDDCKSGVNAFLKHLKCFSHSQPQMHFNVNLLLLLLFTCHEV